MLLLGDYISCSDYDRRVLLNLCVSIILLLYTYDNIYAVEEVVILTQIMIFS